MKSSRLRIIVTGLIAQHPRLGGVAWDYVQYPLGLRLMGHDVYYFEDSGEWPYNVDGGPSGNDWVARDCQENVSHLRSVMTRFGMEDRWAYRNGFDARWYGLSDFIRRDVLGTADLLIDVSGTLERPEEYRPIPRLAYIDSDPVFTQIKLADGDEEFSRRVGVHDVHFSFGEALSDKVPKTPYSWIPTRQPIVLDEWRPIDACRDVVTTVMSWTSYKPRRYQGVSYGQKDVEFYRFLDLPSRLPTTTFEVALGNTEHATWSSLDAEMIPPARALLRDDPHITARELLARMGWRVVKAYDRCGSLDSYREYVRTSRAEWSVAKNGYVRGSPGWFSCRSACYLASGRPVVVQHTGFDRTLPVGAGLFAFDSADEAIASLQEMEGNYAKHSAAARKVASEYFESGKVLGALVTAADSGVRKSGERRPHEELHQDSVR